MTEKKQTDCPVEEVTCAARMATQDEKIKAIKTAIYASSATATLIITAVMLALRFLKP